MLRINFTNRWIFHDKIKKKEKWRQFPCTNRVTRSFKWICISCLLASRNVTTRDEIFYNKFRRCIRRADVKFRKLLLLDQGFFFFFWEMWWQPFPDNICQCCLKKSALKIFITLHSYGYFFCADLYLLTYFSIVPRSLIFFLEENIVRSILCSILLNSTEAVLDASRKSAS